MAAAAAAQGAKRGENVHVVCRFRPMNDSELREEKQRAGGSEVSLLIEEQQNIVGLQRRLARHVRAAARLRRRGVRRLTVMLWADGRGWRAKDGEPPLSVRQGVRAGHDPEAAV
jgi:hypothetical protein